MDFARITPDYAVAPQIAPEDAEAVRAAGFTDVVCNRPDEEVPPDLSADALQAACEAAGLRFHRNPVRNGALGEAEVAAQRAAIAAADGPVLAYCRSGTRSAAVWALGARELDADAILAATSRAGYDLSGLRPHLDTR